MEEWHEGDMAWHGVVLVKVVKVQGWQGLAVMQRGTGMQRECRVGLGPW
jgi:hypothetical protein